MFKKICLSVVLVVASTVSVAESVYGQLNLNRTDIDLDVISDTDTTFGIEGGYSFNDYFAVEFGYMDFGEVSLSGNGASLSVSADAMQLSLIGIAPVSETVGFYGQLGVDMWEAELTASLPGFGSFSETDDGTDIFYGVGAKVSISENVAGIFEYTFHDLDDTEISAISVGVQLSF